MFSVLLHTPIALEALRYMVAGGASLHFRTEWRLHGNDDNPFRRPFGRTQPTQIRNTGH